MFCPNCGFQFEDSVKFCPKCGTKIEPAAPQQPISEPVVEPVAPQQPVVEPVVNTVAPNQPKPKKAKKKGLIAIIASVLVVALLGVGVAFNIDTIGNFFKKTFSSDEEYLQGQYEDKAEDLADKIGSTVGQIASGEITKNAADGEIKLEVNPKLMNLLAKVVLGAGEELDLSWVKDVAISYDINLDGDKYSCNIGLKFNGVTIISADVIADVFDSKMAYVKLNGLLDKYIAVPLDIEDELGDMGEMKEMMEAVAEKLPDEKTIASIINRYVKVVLDQVEETEKEKDTLSVGDVEAKYEKYTIEVNSKLLANMLEAVLEEAKDDKELKDVIKNIASIEEGVDTKQVIEEFEEGIEYALDNISKDMFGDIEFEYTTWIDSKGEIVGLEFEYEGATISVIAPEDGKKSALEIKIVSGDQKIVFSGEGVTKSDKLSGEYDLVVFGQEILTVTVTDYDTKKAEKGYINGTFEIAPAKAIMDSITPMLSTNDVPEDISSLITAGLKLKIKLTSDEKKSEIAVSIVSGSDDMITLLANLNFKEEQKVTVPSEYVDVEDEDALEGLASELDVEKIINSFKSKFKEAGVPSDILDLLENMEDLDFSNGGYDDSDTVSDYDYYF